MSRRRRRRFVLAVGVLLALAVSIGSGGALAYWSELSATGASAVANAATVLQGSTPSATATGTNVTLSWGATTMSSGAAVSGYKITRYNASTLASSQALSGCSSVVTTTTCVESPVPQGIWLYTVTPLVGAFWTGPESAKSAAVTVDTVAPANVLSQSTSAGSSAVSGTTVYYRGVAAGSLALRNAVTDAVSGPASSATSALSGTTSGWTHTPSVVTTPTGGPYTSSTFSWDAGTTSSPTEVVTGKDAAGNQAATTLTFVNDSTPPTATLTYTDGYQPRRSVAVSFTKADSGSAGVTGVLSRASALLANGTCGTYSAFASVGGNDPTSPYADTAVLNSHCYRYKYAVTDAAGNAFEATTTNVARVDYAGAVTTTSGVLSEFRLGDSSGTAADSVGSNSGSYSGGVSVGSSGALPYDADTAATFDGASGSVLGGVTGLPSGSSARSVEMWVKTTSTVQQTLFHYGTRANGAEFGLWINSGGASLTAWGYGAGYDKTFSPTSSITDGRWHQVVETYNGTAITVFVDGAPLPSQSVTLSTAVETAGFAIGRVVATGDPNSGFSMNGSIDEVSVYTAALSPATVADHFLLGGGSGTDITGPIGGSVTAGGLVGTGSAYSTSTTLSLALAGGTDSSGVATAGNRLFRAAAALTSTSGGDGGCGTFGSYALVAADPPSAFSDTVSDGACYRYRYSVSDAVGNYSTYSSASIKVDSSAPSTPTLAMSALTSTYAAGSAVYYRPGASSGSFTVTARSTDGVSGILSYSFPTAAALGTNWTSTSGATGTNTYGWTSGGTPSGSGTFGVTATNNASRTSPAAQFTLTSDATAPAVSAPIYTDGGSSSTTQTISVPTPTDSGSGVAIVSMQRASAALSGSTCGTYSGFTTISTNPGSSYTDTVTTGTCYKYQLVATDNVGNSATATSTNVIMATGSAGTYSSVVSSTASLANYFRLGDAGFASDSFTGSTGTLLDGHSPELGGAWTKRTIANADTTAQITSSGTIRKSGSGTYAALYTSAAAPTSADYTVSADIVTKSVVTQDIAGVVGRVDTTVAAGTYYGVRYDQSVGAFVLFKMVGGAYTVLGTVSGASAAGSTSHIVLDMKGSSIRMIVNGVPSNAVTDTSITASGSAGIFFGFAYSSGNVPTTTSDSTGMQLDDFAIANAMVDKAGTNNGSYAAGPTLGAAGALTGDSDKAAIFDGVNDYASTTRQLAGDFSVELWMKTTTGIGDATTTDWFDGAGLVDADAAGSTNDFGISVAADGRILAGTGNPDTTIVSPAGKNDGNWHHVVFTRTQATGALVLYVDGVQVASGTGGTSSTMPASAVMSFGRITSRTNFFTGSMDEIAVYSTPLSPSTVNAHYAAR